MWPWSTIKSLERKLQGYKAELAECGDVELGLRQQAADGRREIERLAEKCRELRRQGDVAIEQRDEARSLISKAELERDQARQGNTALQNRIDDLVTQLAAHQRQEAHYQENALLYRQEIAGLRTQLLAACKNDTRDPKTGRFTKAPVQ